MFVLLPYFYCIWIRVLSYFYPCNVCVYLPFGNKGRVPGSHFRLLCFQRLSILTRVVIAEAYVRGNHDHAFSLLGFTYHS